MAEQGMYSRSGWRLNRSLDERFLQVYVREDALFTMNMGPW